MIKRHGRYVFINHVNKIKSHILNSSNYDKECENEVSRTA